MKYVDWVEHVLRATVEAFEQGDGYSTDLSAIEHELGVEFDERAEPLRDALRDLEAMGLLGVEGGWFVTIEQEARKIRETSLRTAWQGFHDIWLEAHQERFLIKLCELSECRAERWAHLEFVEGTVVLESLGEQPGLDDAHRYTSVLDRLGLVDGKRTTIGGDPTFPTYAGLVRATEKVATEGQTLVSTLLEDWETTNTDFKRELHLESKDQKAEFVRDVLALANTQVTGRRHLVTGFDPKSHEFTTTFDPSVEQDRIEDILDRFTAPPVTVRYKTFPWLDGSGDVGLLEVIRDRTKVPYRVRQRLVGGTKAIAQGDVFIRHGSHVAIASPEEVADLEGEAERAKGA